MPGNMRIFDEDNIPVGGEDNPLNVEGSVSIIGIAKPSSFYTGQKDIPNTTEAVALAATSTPLVVGRVEVTSLPTNQENSLVYVGMSSVASNSGHVLSPDKTTVIFIDDLSKVYVRTNTSGSDISYQAS